MKQFLKVVAVALPVVLAGCATPSSESPHGSGPSAICHVCQYNNDLACVCVKVNDRTPQMEYQGTTYYFCSDECKAAFAKRPMKYLPKLGSK